MTATAEQLHAAIQDIWAHAVPLECDEQGFVAGGYIVSIGSIHRAMGLIGGDTVPMCNLCEPGSHDCASTPDVQSSRDNES